MAIGTINKVNVAAPSGTNPFGYIKDNTGSNDGTPVDVNTYGDIHQFFDVIMNAAALTYNGLPDNAANGFQLRDALVGAVRNLAIASTSERGVLQIATNAELAAGTANNRMLVPSNFGAWTERNNIADVTQAGGTFTVVTTSRIRYKLVGKTMTMTFFAQVTNTTAPTSFEILIPESKQWASLGSLSVCSIAGVIGDGGDTKQCRILLRDSDKTKLQIVPLTGVALTNTQTTTLSGSITFEVA